MMRRPPSLIIGLQLSKDSIELLLLFTTFKELAQLCLQATVGIDPSVHSTHPPKGHLEGAQGSQAEGTPLEERRPPHARDKVSPNYTREGGG